MKAHSSNIRASETKSAVLITLEEIFMTQLISTMGA